MRRPPDETRKKPPRSPSRSIVDEEGVGTNAWTRTVTRTKVNSRFVSSVTRSQSYAIDEEGNRAIAKAVAKARAPNNVAAVRNGAGSVTAKTSVDVTGNGVASADAGGSIGIGPRRRQGRNLGPHQRRGVLDRIFKHELPLPLSPRRPP